MAAHMNGVLGELNNERQKRRRGPDAPVEPVKKAAPPPAKVSAVEAPACRVEVARIQASAPAAAAAAIVDGSVRRPDAVTVERLIDDDAGSEDGPQCRICLSSEVTEDNPFVSPCDCSGSQQFVHKECLERWQRVCLNGGSPERARVCGTCHAPYTLAPPPAQVALADADRGLQDFVQDYVSDMIFTGGRTAYMTIDEYGFMQEVTKRVIRGGACVIRGQRAPLPCRLAALGPARGTGVLDRRPGRDQQPRPGRKHTADGVRG